MEKKQSKTLEVLCAYKKTLRTKKSKNHAARSVGYNKSKISRLKGRIVRH